MIHRNETTRMRLEALVDVLSKRGPSTSFEIAAVLQLPKGIYGLFYGRQLRYVLNDLVRAGELLSSKNAENVNVYGMPGQEEALTQRVRENVLAVAQASPAYPAVAAVQSGTLDEGLPGRIFKASATSTPQAQLEAKTSIQTKVTELGLRARTSGNANLALVSDILASLAGSVNTDSTVREDADEVEVALAVLAAAIRAPRPQEVDAKALQAQVAALAQTAAEQRARADEQAEKVKTLQAAVESLRRDLGKVNNLRARIKELL